MAAGAVLAALHYRRRTGKGQFIDLSEQEAAIPLMGAALMDCVMNGRLTERQGNRSAVAAPQGCYRCRGGDRWLVISIESDDEWSSFCRAAGHPEWETDERFADVLARHEHHDALDELIEGWTREQDAYEAFHLLQRAGVKAAPVLDGKDLLFDPHFKERGQFDVLEFPIIGRRPVHRHLAAKFDGFETGPGRPAPLLGEHNAEVLQGLLGLSDDEMTALEEEKVIGTEPELPVPIELLGPILHLPYEQFLEMGVVQAIEPDYRQQLGL
jgi:crotonobetainyl-CoA:carnitine CoA-transferase CaiB-like acyl-CoA transferase